MNGWWIEVSADWLAGLLNASWKGAMVAAAVILIHAACGRRLPARWRYALWLLVAVRLVLPYGPTSPLGQVALPATTGVPLLALDPAAVPASAASYDGLAAPAFPDPWSLLVGVWALGLLLYTGRYLLARRRLGRLLRSVVPVDDPETLDLFEDCRRRLGVSGPVALLSTDEVSSPAAYPGRRPAVLLPAAAGGSIPAADLRYVFLHELAHLKQRDGWSELAIRALTALHWFNPIVHWAARRAREDREAACDDRVLALLAPAERKSYGRSLIRVASGTRIVFPQPGLVGIVASKHQLRRRVEMIRTFRAGSHRRTVVLTALLLGLALLSWTDYTALSTPPAKEATPASSAQENLMARNVASVRTLGVAKWRWLESQPVQPKSMAGEEEKYEKDYEESVVDWRNCPAVSHDQVTALLVPQFVAEVPREDAWGHPLEFCMRTRDLGRHDRYLLGVRSPGEDGVFSGPVYSVGPFARDADAEDLVWIDGYFMTWPGKD